MDNLGTLGYSEEQVELLDIAADFCRERSPVEKVRALIGDERGYDPGLWREMADLGWLGVAIPEEHGGVGLSLAEVVPIAEQMGRRLLASPFAATTLAAQALLAAGEEAQKSAWLEPLATGAIGTLALYEAEGDWELGHIHAEARTGGEGLILSGAKAFVLWAEAADVVIASVRHEGKLRLALIGRDAIPDGALRRETIIDETRRSYEFVLDGIEIPADALLDEAKTEAALAYIDLAANLLQSAEMCGGTQGVIDYTLSYLTTRKQFGKIIGEYQALKHPAVDSYVDYENARSHLYSAAHSFGDQGRGEVAIRMAKAKADGAYSHAADRSVQFHGAFGFTYECDAQLYRRSAIWNASQSGDAAWHRKKLADLLF